MAYQNNKRLLHRKEFQMMTPAVTATVAGSFIVKDPLGTRRTALHVFNTGSPALYDVNEDAFQILPSFALGGTFGAGACGSWGLWSNTITASSGSTISVTFSTNITGKLEGRTIWFLTGAGITGLRRTITSVEVNPGSSTTINFTPALPGSTGSSTFKIDSGVYYVFNAYTSLAAGVIRSYDIATGTLTSLTTTGLPATWGTDGRLVGTPSYVGAFATGTATSGGATTLTNSTKNWTFNQWSNYQVRITAGTGIGQVRSIASNTTNALTVSTAWTTNPDATSQYAIEGNDDYLYLLGNGAVTMYRYSISANTWTTLAPISARAAAPGAGMSGNWVSKTGDTFWQNESAILDGRFLYSFRGAGTADLHRYDIALNTWATISYQRPGETFTTGSCWDVDGPRIYGMKESTGRFFYYDVTDNEITGFTTDFYPQSTAVVGDKIFTVSYDDGAGGDVIDWIYYLGNSTATLRRIMIY